jgi:mRNA-degrading endonuclease RelE of RelBE toxin-antitoxin system
MATRQCHVELTQEAEKDIKRLRPHIDKVTRAIAKLEGDPFLGHRLSESFKGARSLAFALPGSGAYRAVYFLLDDNSVCLVFLVGPHENIYDKAKRRVDALKRAGRI